MDGDAEAEGQAELTPQQQAGKYPQVPQHIQVKFSATVKGSKGERKTTRVIPLGINCWVANLLDALRQAVGVGPEASLDLASEDGQLQGLGAKALDEDGQNLRANAILEARRVYILVSAEEDENGTKNYTALWDEREPAQDEEGKPILDEDGNPTLADKEGFPFAVKP